MRDHAQVVTHLFQRTLNSSHRRSALGWSWPLIMQLTQLAVLVFVFRRVIPLDIPDYPTFVFTGLIFWNFFSGGLQKASSAVTDNVALANEPRLPTFLLPLVALMTAGFDLAVAFPLLLVLVITVIGLTWAAPFLLVILLIQLVLMAGIALLASAAHVHVRDVKPLLSALLLLAFYMTPVFYSLDNLPSGAQAILLINPMSTLVDGYHTVLIDGEVPDLLPLAILAAVSLAVLAVGAVVFRRLRPGFSDVL
ncbi:MAG: ABC transporter permease [Thermoleophilia bacterium]